MRKTEQATDELRTGKYMKDTALVDEWLKRAYSNLERARAGKVSEEILFEDLCFDCQQAVS
jgi:HEPN domain-containing protein